MNATELINHLPAAAGLFAAGLLLAAALSAEAASPSDAKAVEGAWTPLKAEIGGRAMDQAVLKTISLKLQDGKYEVLVAGHPDKGTYTIEPAAQPKGMSVTGTEGPNQGKTFPAIYELEGTTLRICYDLSGKKRPQEFKTEAGTLLYLVTYTRAKE